MSNTSLDISKTIEPLQRDLLTSVFAVAHEIQAPLLVTGAAARDLILDCGYDIRATRATTDVDVGVEVANWGRYEEIRTILLTDADFTAAGEPHRLMFRQALPLDLLPFGGVEDAETNIRWPSSGAIMSMLGYSEACRRAMQVRIDDGVDISVVGLPDLALLKLIAWHERGAQGQPRKDAADFTLIARHYLDAGNRERLYEEYAEWLDEADFDYTAASARLLGRDAGAAASGRLKHTVTDVVRRGLSPDDNYPLLGAMGDDFDAMRALADAFRLGFAET